MSSATALRARQLCDGLVGRRSGIVTELAMAETIDGDAKLHHAGARIARTHPELEHYSGIAAGGCGASREEAIIAALCEAAERYAASSYDYRSMLLAKPGDLASPHVNPRELAAFSPAQRAVRGFPYPKITPDTPLRWVAGRDLLTGESCHVPAFAVHVPYVPDPPEPQVQPSLSNGLCCGDSLEQATLGAVCELIERDAVTLTWLKGITPPRIDDAILRQEAGDLLPPFDSACAYDLTSDIGLPVLLVVCRGPGPRGELVSVGAACNTDDRQALRKAAMEASQDRVYVRMLIEQDPAWQPAADFSNITDFPLHARMYSGNPALAQSAFSFLDEAPSAADWLEQSRAAGRDDVLPLLRDRGLSGAVVDLTPEWARPLKVHIVRAIIPGLLPLHGQHALAFLGHPRLRNWRTAIPHGIIRHRNDCWPFPHPFP